jgi:phosphatidyl-myo-inositol dimannoside synthase
VRCVAVGRFVLQKGFDILVSAWGRLVASWPTRLEPPELVMVGDGPRREQLRRQVTALGLDGRVRMTGALPRSAVLAELQQARVFTLPVRSRLAGLNAEGLGLAAVEAAACGLPVVVARSGGAPEAVVDGMTGAVVPPEDPGSLAAALRPLLLDADYARAMGVAGRRHAAAHFGSDQARRTLRQALALE